MSEIERKDPSPGLAALLSLVAPGIGQVYTGHFLWAIFWLVVTPGFWITTAGLLGWPFHLVAAWQAYRQAERRAGR